MLKKRDSSIWFMKSEIRNSALSEGYVSTWRYVQDYKDFRDKTGKEKAGSLQIEPAFFFVSS